MSRNRRVAVAYTALLLSALASVGAGYVLIGRTHDTMNVSSHHPAATSALTDPRTIGARQAASALFGAVNNYDAVTFCSLLSANALEQSGLGPTREACAKNGNTMTALANLQAQTAILFVTRTSPTQTRVRVSVDGAHYFFYFVLEPDGHWRFSFAEQLSGSAGATPSG